MQQNKWKKLKPVQLIRRQDFLLSFLEKISKELISISFHSDEIRLHNIDTNAWVYLLLYSLRLTYCCLVIHSQNEGRVVRKWPKDRNHFVGGKSFVSIQALLAKIQEHVASTVPACMLLLPLCLPLCNAMDCSPPGSSVVGTLQARMLEQVAISSARGSFQPRDRTHIS